MTLLSKIICAYSLRIIISLQQHTLSIFSQNDNVIGNENNEYSITSSKDGIADKILNGSKSIFDKVLSPSKEKLSFSKVCFDH